MNIFKLTIILITVANATYAQLPQIKTVNATVMTVEPGMIVVPKKDKYKKAIDSLDKNLKTSPNDTTSLFYRALLYYSYNQMLAEPYQRTKGTMENLTIAKDMIERAIGKQMSDLRAKILRAQIYAELAYRFTGDESWMFSAGQLAARKKLYLTYRQKANEYYDELAKIDPKNEYYYSRKKN